MTTEQVVTEVESTDVAAVEIAGEVTAVEVESPGGVAVVELDGTDETTVVVVESDLSVAVVESPPVETVVVSESIAVETVVVSAGRQGPPGTDGTDGGPTEVYDSATPPSTPTFPYIRFERDGAGDVQSIYLGTVT